MPQPTTVNPLAYTLALLVSLLLTCNVSARTVVECRDPDGTLSYRDHCPPNEAKTGEKRLRQAPQAAELSTAEIAKKNPITLFSVPNCDACDLVRMQLQARAIPFTEKDVSTAADTQKELQAASGALTVPTVMIGDQAQAGYDRAALNQRLTEVGFKPAPGVTAGTASSKPTSN
jgi:glutaredoxin